ncbi:MAG: hypothetical protein ACK56I_16930, partial [bacterium]
MIIHHPGVSFSLRPSWSPGWPAGRLVSRLASWSPGLPVGQLVARSPSWSPGRPVAQYFSISLPVCQSPGLPVSRSPGLPVSRSFYFTQSRKVSKAQRIGESYGRSPTVSIPKAFGTEAGELRYQP